MTKPLFERINNGEFTVLLSTMLDEELEFAPKNIKNLLANLDDNFTEFLKDNDDAVNLASEYIDEKLLEKQVMQIVCI